LVRPNQGLIAPGGSETVQIILVEKDKVTLWQSYQRLGQSALDHSKDKFLVQSCAVSSSFVSQFESSNGYDHLSAMWTTVMQPGSKTAVSNKKLQVKHVVSEDSANNNNTATPSSSARDVPKHEISIQAMEQMPHDQLMQEVTNLRRKYDELVAFSVNLTAERDILNNTLEQTKRDLNREMSKSAAQDNKRGSGSGSGSGSHRNAVAGGLWSWLPLLLTALSFLLLGVRLEQMGQAGFVKHVPVVGKMLHKPVVDLPATVIQGVPEPVETEL
jgi:hypothetical protein